MTRGETAAEQTIHIALQKQAIKSATWLVGQPKYGVIPPAERIVLDCLRALQAIPEADRMYADELTDIIASGFLATACGIRNQQHRACALLRIAGGSA